ncbi:MAG: hypothetical protein M1829_005120 [Trizodia sp. TS-e1964]|nr:MAG: hypothetical protein M1829_005120 [Trizodia sp. TS-e1964]
MAFSHGGQYGALPRDDAADTELTPITTPSTVASPPTSASLLQPAAHRRLGSRDHVLIREAEVDIADSISASSPTLSGLGLSTGTQRSLIQRVPVGSKVSPQSDEPVSPIDSPPVFDQHHGRGHSLEGPGSFLDSGFSHQSYSLSQEDQQLRVHQSQASTAPSGVGGGRELRDLELVLTKLASLLGDAGPPFDCSTNTSFFHGRGQWLSVTVLILSIFSTVFSGIYLVIAIVKPRYGRSIHSGGSLSPSTASLLAALFAKAIELSFVTVFVGFLGQVLTRKAFLKTSSGITIADMSMRSWIMQPGTLITHWETVRYAGLSLLGAVSLTVAFISIFYTTASDALGMLKSLPSIPDCYEYMAYQILVVSPKLKFGDLEDHPLFGRVSASYANAPYLAKNCRTPILERDDADGGSTCLAISHAGQSFRNFQQYMANWTERISTGSSTSDLNLRPAPVALLYDNTTVEGSWIEVKNQTQLSIDNKRGIVNVTMAMPHPGVFAAARDPINDILQPNELEGLGEYNIVASVPSPAVNILCAILTSDELDPFVYERWENATVPFNNTLWPNQIPLASDDQWLNKTAVDDIFGFGKNKIRQPVFPKVPIRFNTILNTTGWYDKNSIFLLGTSPSGTYTLCSIHSYLSPNCSTQYHASSNGGTLRAHCEDPNDQKAYRFSHPEAPNGLVYKDYRDVASTWGNSLSMNTGVTDGNASNSRLLTEFIPTDIFLNPSLPSTAETLAVLSSSALLLAAQDSPFIHEWNYSTTIPFLLTPQYQRFNASLQTQQYASGGTQQWQGLFYVVLALVFVTNLLCLAYMLAHRENVTDYTEAQNLFAVSLNSPPSRRLEGSCGGGPVDDQLGAAWYVVKDDKHHFYFEAGRAQPRARRRGMPREQEADRISLMYSKVSSPDASRRSRVSFFGAL